MTDNEIKFVMELAENKGKCLERSRRLLKPTAPRDPGRSPLTWCADHCLIKNKMRDEVCYPVKAYRIACEIMIENKNIFLELLL